MRKTPQVLEKRGARVQVKEAHASVVEGYAGKSVFSNHGERVVNGHRLIQSASDIFLGCTAGKLGDISMSGSFAN